MSVVIAAIVSVLGVFLVGAGAVIRLGAFSLVMDFDGDSDLSAQVRRGGLPVALAGVLSLAAGAFELSSPIPTVGWLGYTIAFLGLVFFGAARAGGS